MKCPAAPVPGILAKWPVFVASPATFAVPLKLMLKMLRAVARAVAVPALPLTLVWSPVFVPLRLLPVTAPDAATLVGVIAPSVRLMAGVVVAVATVPLTPFAVVTETLVTVPTAESLAFSVVPLMLRFVPSVMPTGNPVPPVLACPSSCDADKFKP